MAFITSCLSGLNAESPSLRRMKTGLFTVSTFGRGKEEIQARLHKLVHRGLATSRDATMTLAAAVAKSTDEGVPEPEPWPTGSMEAQHDVSPPLVLTSDANAALPWEDTMMYEHQLAVQRMLEDTAESQMNVLNEAVSFNRDRNAELLRETESDAEISSYLESPGSLDCHYLHEEAMVPEREISTLDSHEWLDLSQASLVLDETGQCIPFDELDDGDYSYHLLPL